MNIVGNIVTLRAIEEEDLEFLKELVNDIEIERLIVGASFPVSTFQQRQWYNSVTAAEHSLRLIIETKDEGRVGYASIANINWKNRSASHGIKIAKEFRGKGIGTDTVMAIMRYVFDELQLNRLDTAIIEYNKASRALYCDKCGWEVEGLKRCAIYKNGKYHNLLMVGILKEDYMALVKNNKYWDNV